MTMGDNMAGHYLCKIASPDEMQRKWAYEIDRNVSDRHFLRQTKQLVTPAAVLLLRPDVGVVVVNRDVEYLMQVFEREARARTAAGVQQQLRLSVPVFPADRSDLLL